MCKYDLNGNLIWYKKVSAYTNSEVKVSKNYLYVKTGAGNSFNPCFIHKYDTLGNLIWSQPSGMSYVWNMTTDDNGSSYLIGQGGGTSMAKKFNSSGSLVWTITSDSLAWYNAVINNDTVYICGSTGGSLTDIGNSSIRRSSISLHSAITGVMLSNNYIDVIPGFVEQADIIFKDGSDFYLAGAGGFQMTALYLAKLNFTNSTTAINSISIKENNLQIFPNPAPGIFELCYKCETSGNIQINVYDAKGKLVFKESPSQFTEEYKTKIDLGNQSPGVYFIEAIVNRKKITKQIILQ